MKKYVLLTFAVPGIGGTQIYARNKILYLQEHGYEPIVITEEEGGDIVVKELLPYKDFVVPELLYSPMMMSRTEREVALNKMASIIGAVDENTLIESNFIHATLWGELLAKKLGVKHMILLIQEDYSLSDKRYMKYFSFKYDRRELAANTPVALSKLFEGFRTIDDPERAYLNPYCSNTVEDCESEHFQGITEADWHIGSIGRLNKPFVFPMVKDVIEFARLHHNKTIQLVLFGGSPEEQDIENIREAVSKQANLSVYITGPVFPVPLKMMEKMDVFISSAGSANTSANVGFVTIAIDANDYEPIGIVDNTTITTVHRQGGTDHKSTILLLNEVLVSKKYEKTNIVFNDLERINSDFNKHLAFIEAMAKTRDYYRIKKISPSLFKRILKRFSLLK